MGIRLGAFAPLVVLLLGLGCRSSPDAPNGTVRVYWLVSVDGTALPASVPSRDGGIITVTGEWLVLDEKGMATRHRYVSGSAAPVVAHYAYVLAGQSITLGVCGAAEICLASEAGVMTESMLTLTIPTPNASSVLVYDRSLPD